MTVAEGVRICIVVVGTARLQWGRNLTVAEGAPHDQGKENCLRLQWGRNLTVAEGGSQARRACTIPARFNGAAT